MNKGNTPDKPLAVVTELEVLSSIAKGLADNGIHVILVARTVGGLEELDNEITRSGGSCTLAPLDLLIFRRLTDLALRFSKGGEIRYFHLKCLMLGQVAL